MRSVEACNFVSKMFPIDGWVYVSGAPLAQEIFCHDWIECWRDDSGTLVVCRPKIGEAADYQVSFSGYASFVVSFGKQQLFKANVAPGTPELALDHFVADQVLPRVLAHQGKLVLHAGAVEVEGRAIVLLGQSGRGKSTLSASFDRACFPIIGDDALIIDWECNRPVLQAVYPSLRLLPDSLDALGLGQVPVSPVAHYTPKQRVDLPLTVSRGQTPLPIAAIFVLAEPASNDAISLRTMSPAETCLAIISNSFALDPTDKTLAAKKLQQASSLANQFPAFEISYPREYSRLPDVRAAICSKLSQPNVPSEQAEHW